MVRKITLPPVLLHNKGEKKDALQVSLVLDAFVPVSSGSEIIRLNLMFGGEILYS